MKGSDILNILALKIPSFESVHGNLLNGKTYIQSGGVRVWVVVDDYGRANVYIKYDAYVGDCIMTHRIAFEWDSPDHLYNYLKNNGVEHPEWFRIEHPLKGVYMSEYAGRSLEDLIAENILLKRELESAYSNGF